MMEDFASEIAATWGTPHWPRNILRLFCSTSLARKRLAAFLSAADVVWPQAGCGMFRSRTQHSHGILWRSSWNQINEGLHPSVARYVSTFPVCCLFKSFLLAYITRIYVIYIAFLIGSKNQLYIVHFLYSQLSYQQILTRTLILNI